MSKRLAAQSASPVTSIPALSTLTSTTPVVLNNVIPRSWHTAHIIGTAGIASGAVTLEGSLDGTNWVALASAVTAVASTTTPIVNAAGIPALYVRARISTVISGGTITVKVASA